MQTIKIYKNGLYESRRRIETVDLVDGGAGDGVEEEADEEQEQQNREDLDDQALVVAPQNVAKGLQWVHQPQEGVVWATERSDRVKNISGKSWILQVGAIQVRLCTKDGSESLFSTDLD